MAVVGYVRVSTVEQNTDRQLDGVKLDKLFEDRCSGKDTKRPALKALLEYVREGDEVVVHDISRMARNLQDLLHLVQGLNSRGISLRFNKENLLFAGDAAGKASPMNKLMLSMLGAVYEFERSMILERQKEGIAKAKQAGKYQGGKQRADRDAIIKALDGGMSIRKVADALGVGVSTVQRVKAGG